MALKKPSKDQRERLVLLGLVDLYLSTGKPVGSNALREEGDFKALSSATIRNYFAKLEEEGYLRQQHSSGGRIPTHLAYKLYAEEYLSRSVLEDKEKEFLRSHLVKESRDIAAYLQRVAEFISERTQCAVFLSSPRFDQDFVLDIKLLAIDSRRFLCAIITDFGLIHTETLYLDPRFSNVNPKKIEAYFQYRLNKSEKPKLTEEEEAFASRLYQEIHLRHIVNYTHFSTEDIYKTGFSKLLAYPDFNDAAALASGLSLFENPSSLRALVKDTCKKTSLSCWIGDDLYPFCPAAHACSVIAAPYKIHQAVVGSLAILGPNRIPYRKLFAILHAASEAISETLTRSLYKFKISFRQPQEETLFLNQERCLLLENQGEKHS